MMPFWAITQEVRAILTLYNRCQERGALPYPGGVFDQPEAVMADFDLIDVTVAELKKLRREQERQAGKNG